MPKLNISIDDIKKAQAELEKYLPPTPLLRNVALSEKFGCELYLKLENMQPIGSFKIRGASYKISKLTDEERKKGVIAASAGNHAQGVAWGSRHHGVKCTIVMPKTASLVKVQNTRALGAEIILEGDTYDEAYKFAIEHQKKSGQIFVHAFEDESVIAGQGTVALEIMSQLPSVDFVIGSVGGGGLMSGVALAFRALSPLTKIVACQASGAASMLRSLSEGKAVKLASVDTFADGIAVSAASEQIRSLLSGKVDHFLQADDEAIANALLMLLEKAKIISEGSGAVPLAVLDQLQNETRGKKVVLLISGGNIDVNLLSRIIDRGLIRAGRRVRVNVIISDRPGSLARLTEVIAKQGANVIQAIHDRNEPGTAIDQTDVALTLETRGPEHSEKLIEALKQTVLRLELAH